MAAEKSFYATGKRKTAIARVWLKAGSGSVNVNKLGVDEYFGNIGDIQQKIDSPFALTDTLEKYDVIATLKGGGKSAQADALRHGISKALLEVDSEHRITLKKAGFLTRDSRIKERNTARRVLAQASSFQSVNNRILSHRFFNREGHKVLFPVFVCRNYNWGRKGDVPHWS